MRIRRLRRLSPQELDVSFPAPLSSAAGAFGSRVALLQRRAENVREPVIPFVARVLVHLAVVFNERHGQRPRTREGTRILDSRRVLENAIVDAAEPLDDLHLLAAATIVTGRLLGAEG